VAKVMDAERRAFLTTDEEEGNADDAGAESNDSQHAKARSKQAIKSSSSKASLTCKAVPSEIRFDEQNAVHFAAEKKDPDRFQFLHELKVQRLAETSKRMKNHAALVRNKAAQTKELAQRRDLDVRARMDHKQRMRLIEEQMAEELMEPSEHSHALGSIVLGVASPKQQESPRTRSRSPNWRTQRIKNPLERLADEKEEIEQMLNDPVDGWGWSDKEARASRKGNFSELPFRDQKEDLAWLVPEHLKNDIITAPRPRDQPRGSSGSDKKAPSSAQALVRKVASLW
jgi:hypothetical protein